MRFSIPVALLGRVALLIAAACTCVAALVIPEATAADAGAGAPSTAAYSEILMIGAFVAIFYFLVLRPQSKRAKEHKSLLGGLAKGDEVVTSGGIVGTVTKVEDQFVVCKVSDNVELRFQKHAVAATLPKGTLKSLNEK